MKAVLRSALVCALSVLPVTFPQAMSLHAMVYQGHMVELHDTRQLTSLADGLVDEIKISPNGEYVACMSTNAESSGRVLIVRTSGGRPTIIASGTGRIMDQVVRTGGEVNDCRDADGFRWAPDSRSIALLVTRFTVDRPQIDPQTGDEIPGRQKAQTGLLIASVGGAKRSFVPLPDEVQQASQLFWSSDGSKLAARCLLRNPVPVGDVSAAPTNEWSLLIVNRNSGYVRSIYKCPAKESIELKGWGSSGKALLCRSVRDRKVSLLTVSSEGKGVTDQSEDKADDLTISPDGAHKLVTGPGGTIEECATGRKIPVSKSSSAGFIGWVPNSTMAMYAEPEELKDESGKRKEMVVRMWLGVPDASKANCMLLAHGITAMPQWSADASRVAYINEGMVFVAQLVSRDANAYEKLDAGLALSDEEMQELVNSQAKQAGLAMLMYAQDNDGKLPDDSTAVTDLAPYVKNDGIFRMPGGGDGIFHSVTIGNINSVPNPSETMIGYMDVGRGWVARIYADGHTRIIKGR